MMREFPARVSYCIDDLLLVPRYSEIKSRKDIDLSVNLGKGIKVNYPIVPAPMQTITGVKMAKTIASLGGLALLNRFSGQEIDEMFADCLVGNPVNDTILNHVGASVGIKEEDQKKVDKLIWRGCKIINIDVANGHSKYTCDFTSWVAKKYPDILLIVGNVATNDGALRLYNSGANIIRCGIGNGSCCSTRIKSGNGLGLMTSLFEVFQASLPTSSYSKDRKFKIIADGGVKNSGDCVKALCFADLVMSGSLFAATRETPGEIIREDGIDYKRYVGSSTHSASGYVEGVESLVPIKGHVGDMLDELLFGCRSGLSYQGCKDLEQLKVDPQFVIQTGLGSQESFTHIFNQHKQPL